MKKSAVLILFIYCGLCLLAYSPIHFSIIHETKGPLSAPLNNLPVAEGSKQCPLCNFSNMVLFLEIAALLYCITFKVGRVNSIEKYIIPRNLLRKIYSILAPPERGLKGFF